MKSRKKKFLRRLIEVLAIGVFLWLIFTIAARILPPLAIKQISELTNTNIKVKSLNFNLNGSVLIERLEIKPKEQVNYDNTILRAKKVYARFGIGSLLLLKPKLKKISVRDFVFDAQQDLGTGLWNLGTIRMVSGGGAPGEIPFIRLKDGILKYSKVSRNRVKAAAAIPINVWLKTSKKMKDAYDFEIITAKRDTYRASTLKGTYKPGTIIVTGGISSKDIPAFEKAWIIDVLAAEYKYDNDKNYQLTLKMKDFTSKEKTSKRKIELERPKFLEKLSAFSAFQKFMGEYRPMGKIDVELQATGNLDSVSNSEIKGAIYCKDVSVRYNKFPYLIKNLAGPIEITQNHIRAENLRGRHRNVDLALNISFSDFGPNLKRKIQITSDNMVLDDDLYDALWPNHKKLWKQFTPDGLVAFNYTFTTDPQKTKKYTLDVNLIDVNSTFTHFPYPMENLTGNLFFDRNSIKVNNLFSQMGERRILINGKLTNTNTSQIGYDLLIDVNNIPLDETLVSALPQKQRNIYNQFEISGIGDGQIKVFNRKDNPKTVDFAADLNFRNTSLKMEAFPSAFTGIRANGIFRSDSIEFRSFNGDYGKSKISMQGKFQPSIDGEKLSYEVTLSSEKTELDDDLFNLIPEHLREVVNQLKPTGQINYKADLVKDYITGYTDYKIGLDCLNVNIEPVILEMPLENLRGKLKISKSNIELINITANTPRDTPAEPNNIKINGNIRPASGNTDNQKTGLSSGDISLQAKRMVAAGKTLTNLNTDIHYDGNSQGWVSENLISEFYSGKLAGGFIFKHAKDSQGQYVLNLGFEDVNLEQFLNKADNKQEHSTEKSLHTKGKMDGSLNVAGIRGDIESYFGTCKLNITDMQVGQLSPIAKLLQVLQLTEPSDYAFERMIIDSHIKDGKVFFERLELIGEGIVLNGPGWMSLKDKNIELMLTAKGLRLAQAEPSVLESLTDALSPAVVRIDVTGNLYEPQIVTTPLPMIKGTLELLGTKEGSSN